MKRLLVFLLVLGVTAVMAADLVPSEVLKKAQQLTDLGKI